MDDDGRTFVAFMKKGFLGANQEVQIKMDRKFVLEVLGGMEYSPESKRSSQKFKRLIGDEHDPPRRVVAGHKISIIIE